MSDDEPKEIGRTADTLAVHGGEPRRYRYDAITAPIVQTATYTFRDTAELVAFMEGRLEREEYGRYGNPTVRLVEEKVAALEGAADGLAFASGMAAITTALFALLRSGDHVILFADCYRRTRSFVAKVLSRFGVEHTLVPSSDLAALEAAFLPSTKLVISEAPTNPYLGVVDLPALVALCKARRVKTLIDSTFATPLNLRPLEHGADLVVHSATKYLAGHNDVLAGVLVGKAGLISLAREARGVLGGVCDPHAAYLVHRGLKTLALRVPRQNQSGLALAQALEGHPKVRAVYYPLLPSHPDHAAASRLLAGGGGVVTFRVASDLAGTGRFIDALRIPRIGPSLGGVESLVEQPALVSYFELSSEARAALGMHDDLVRYAVGIEDPDELIADVLRALEAI